MKIVAYTYLADIHCENCIAFKFEQPEDEAPSAMTHDAEEILDYAAKQRGIDRMDEYSFDSDEFPKVVFSTQIEDDEYCGTCHNEITY
jgi:hypothetical protein